jgi:hypothetical protein
METKSNIPEEMRNVYRSVITHGYKLYCDKRDYYFPDAYELTIVRHETEATRSLTDWTGTVIPISFELLQDIDARYMLQPGAINKIHNETTTK